MRIIADFSKTFTQPDMPTTWSVFVKNGILWEEYIQERDALYREYRPYELAWDLGKTREWFYKHACLFVKYGLTKEQIDQVLRDDRYFAPRDGVVEFLKTLQERNIPLTLVTSGISYFVQRWFELRFSYALDGVYGTHIIFDPDGQVTGVEQDSVICPLDKNIDSRIVAPFGDRIILIGDSSEDCDIVSRKEKTLGFIDPTEDSPFDIPLGKQANMQSVLEYI
jgi:phosphoserine phosphatase